MSSEPGWCLPCWRTPGCSLSTLSCLLVLGVWFLFGRVPLGTIKVFFFLLRKSFGSPLMSRVGVSPNPLLAWNLLCNSCQRLLKILPRLLTPGFKCTQPYPELELCFEEILQEILALDQYLQSWDPDRSRRTFWSLCVHSQSGSLARPKMRSRYNWFIFVLQLFVLPFRDPEHILMISSTVMSPTIHIIADLYHRLQ